MKVIFMGTPVFAVAPLLALLGSSHEVVAVYTNPPKERGRGLEVHKTIIHKIAEEHGISVFTPKKLTDPKEVAQLHNIEADVIIVAAYGKLLRKEVLYAKKLGCLNIHPSLLPRWRGAAPLERTIMAGDKQSAVCIMQMDEGLDTGDVLRSQDFTISEVMSIQELHNFTSTLGAKLLLEVLNDMAAGTNITPLKQEGEAIYAHKLTAEEEKIDWRHSAQAIYNQIRALSPKPGAYFMHNSYKIKIITAEYDAVGDSGIAPGTVVDEDLSIQCGQGILRPQLVQREGKKMIYVKAFLRGFPINTGIMLQY